MNSHENPTPQVIPVNVEPAKIPDANISVAPQTNSIQTAPQTNHSPIRTTQPNGALPNAENANNQPLYTNGLKSMKLEAAPLHMAIQLIADSGHLTVTIASGTPNPTVKINFQDMAPLDMLKELGQQYAFTTVLDGQHAILIFPKKDEDEGQITDINR
jgi:type II secretory pathway component GspD/PulD (secretin)